jgi:hypothetical protein
MLVAANHSEAPVANHILLVNVVLWVALPTGGFSSHHPTGKIQKHRMRRLAIKRSNNAFSPAVDVYRPGSVGGCLV